MTILETIKKHKIKVITLFLYAVTLGVKTDIFMMAVKTTGGYLLEMIQILPVVFVVSGLITVWVPRELIMKNFGKNSGLKGKLTSILIGSISAGPIYAAFPVAFSLLRKGASIANIVIIISSWAVIKIPMMVVESKFLGVNFMVARSLLTIPIIILMAYIIEKRVSEKAVLQSSEETRAVAEIEELLPQYNCGGCDYESCRAYAEGLISDQAPKDKCKVGGNQLETKLEEIMDKIKGGSLNEDY